MGDRYANFANSGMGRGVVKRLGLPDPPRLRRYQVGDPLTNGPVLLGAAPGGRLVDVVGKLFETTTAFDEQTRYGALLLDATGITDSTGLRALYDYFHPAARSLRGSGRVIVLGTPPSSAAAPRESTAQRALEGLTRSIGKEFGRGITSQLVQVEPGGEQAVESTLRFLLSGRSAYVSGQVIRIGAGNAPAPADWDRPLAGKNRAGHRRGPGHRRGHRPGARPGRRRGDRAGRAGRRDALAGVANDVRGRAIQLDLTAPDAPFAVGRAPHRAGHPGAQRRHHPGQDDRPDGREPVGLGARPSTCPARNASTTCCCPAT